MQFAVRQDGPTHVVTLAGDLQIDEGTQFHRRLAGLVGPAAPHLVLDLSGLEFINSEGLAAIVESRGTARQFGGAVHLVNPKPHIERLLKVAHIDRLFFIHRTLEAALAATGAAKPNDRNPG